MNCARCSAQIPDQSQFCLRCGAPTQSVPGGMAQNNALPATPSSVRALAVVVALLFLLAAFGLGAMVMRGDLTQKPNAPAAPDTLVQAPAESEPTTLVQAPEESAPGPLVQTPPEKTESAPVEVEAYVHFLKDIEEKKQRLTSDQMAGFMGYVGDLQGLQAGKEVLEKMDEESGKPAVEKHNNSLKDTEASSAKRSADSEDQWNQLTAEFNSKTPPPNRECIELHDKYLKQLGRIQGAMTRFEEMMKQLQSGGDASQGWSVVSELQRADAEIDGAIAAANDALNSVCAKYNIKKDFEIKKDFGSVPSAGALLH